MARKKGDGKASKDQPKDLKMPTDGEPEKTAKGGKKAGKKADDKKADDKKKKK